METCFLSPLCSSSGLVTCASFLPVYCCCGTSLLGAFQAYIGPRNYSMILGFGITFIVCYLTLGIMSCALPDVPAKTVKQTLQIQGVPQQGAQMPITQYQMPQQYQQIYLMPQQPYQVLQPAVQQIQPQPVVNQFQPPQQPVQPAGQEVQPITSPLVNGGEQFPSNMGYYGAMMF